MNRLRICVGAHLQAKSDVADRRIPGGDNGVRSPGTGSIVVAG